MIAREDGCVIIVRDPQQAASWICAFDLESGRELWTRKWTRDGIPLWSDGGRHVIVASGQTAQLFDLEAGRPLSVFRGHDGPITHARLSADGHRALAATPLGKVKVWDAVTGREICTLNGPLGRGEFSPDGKRIVTGHYNGAASVWDADSGRVLSSLKVGRVRSPVYGAAFSPDGGQVAAGNAAGMIGVWEAGSGRELLSMRGHGDEIWCLRYSPDGRRILSTSYDHTAKLWDAVTGRELLTLRGTARMLSAAFSPDGRRIVTVSADNTVKVWEAAPESETTGPVLAVSRADPSPAASSRPPVRDAPGELTPPTAREKAGAARPHPPGPGTVRRALRLQAKLTDPATGGSQAAGDYVVTYAYVIIAQDVGYQVEAGDRLAYEVLIPPESTLNSGAVDFSEIEGVAGSDTLRDSSARDQFGFYSHPASDLSKVPRKADGTPNFVRGQWMTREIALTEQEGGTMNTFVLAFDEHDLMHGVDQVPIDERNPEVIAYFRNIRFVDEAGKTKQWLYNNEATLANRLQKVTDTLWLSDTVIGQSVSVVDDPNPENK
jgi:hypothetical protein